MSETSVNEKPGRQRPLSPHLQIYKPQLTSILSISHRASGIFLTLGLVLFSWWVIALASGPNDFVAVRSFLGSIIGQIVLIACTWALLFHLGTGIRHLFWDAGYGFSIKATYRSGYIVLGFAFSATVLIWFAGMILWTNGPGIIAP